MESRSSLAYSPPFIRLVRRVDLPFKLGSGATLASVFHVFKHALKAWFFSWLAFSNDKFFSTSATYHPPPTYCPSYSYIKKELILCPGYKPTTCNPSLAPGLYED